MSAGLQVKTGLSEAPPKGCETHDTEPRLTVQDRRTAPQQPAQTARNNTTQQQLPTRRGLLEQPNTCPVVRIFEGATMMSRPRYLCTPGSVLPLSGWSIFPGQGCERWFCHVRTVCHVSRLGCLAGPADVTLCGRSTASVEGWLSHILRRSQVHKRVASRRQ